jgi:hypothetical protein
MTAASRRSSNELPWHALRSIESSMLVKHGAGFLVSFGGRSRAIGSGMPSSTGQPPKELLRSTCRPSAFQVKHAERYADLRKRTSLRSETALGGRCEIYGSSALRSLHTRQVCLNLLSATCVTQVRAACDGARPV